VYHARGAAAMSAVGLPGAQEQSVFASFNPEPKATAIIRGKNTVAVGSGLNEIPPYLEELNGPGWIVDGTAKAKSPINDN
jgi:hypothetical protein